MNSVESIQGTTILFSINACVKAAVDGNLATCVPDIENMTKKLIRFNHTPPAQKISPCLTKNANFMSGGICEMTFWGYFYAGIKDDLKNESDIIVAITHWYMIGRGIRCLGFVDAVRLMFHNCLKRVLLHRNSCELTNIFLMNCSFLFVCIFRIQNVANFTG